MNNELRFSRIQELDSLRIIARNIGQNFDTLPDAPITAFMAMIGNQYRGELMVVGRAVNGWIEGCKPQELNDSRNVNSFIERVLQSVTDGDPCPMQWVSESWGNYDHGDYNTKKSAFWRVIRRVVDELSIADVESPEWPSHLMWSNLYKFAPAKKGRNPSSGLCSIQFNECKSLIEQEISTFSPKRILFLTGMNWAEPFIERLMVDVTAITGYQYVEGIDKISSSSQAHGWVVVAAHPQGKKEDIWVDEVISAFTVRKI